MFFTNLLAEFRVPKNNKAPVLNIEARRGLNGGLKKLFFPLQGSAYGWGRTV